MTLKKTGKEKQFLYLETGGEKTVERAKNSKESQTAANATTGSSEVSVCQQLREDACPALILRLPPSPGGRMKVDGKDTNRVTPGRQVERSA